MPVLLGCCPGLFHVIGIQFHGSLRFFQAIPRMDSMCLPWPTSIGLQNRSSPSLQPLEDMFGWSTCCILSSEHESVRSCCFDSPPHNSKYRGLWWVPEWSSVELKLQSCVRIEWSHKFRVSEAYLNGLGGAHLGTVATNMNER